MILSQLSMFLVLFVHDSLFSFSVQEEKYDCHFLQYSVYLFSVQGKKHVLFN